MTSQCICPTQLKTLHMIEYPGFVKNPVKALDTLGGLESIEKVFDSHKDRLELKFRKADPLAHPAYGDRVPKKCLVMRIRKVKGDEGEGEFNLSVVGKIQTSFKFETLAEFQWLPMQRTNMVDKIKPDDILPLKNPFDNTLKTFSEDAPLLILPAVFSRFDTPREIHQPHPKFRSKEMRDEFERQQSMSIIGRTRKKRSTMSYLLNYGDKVPDLPPEKLIKERSMLSPQEQSLIPKLERCFDKQKVWSKAGLCYSLNCSTLDIKYILPLIAYHYLNGPFRTMWVRYGYDPHKDLTSKLLQTLDFRVKNPLDHQEYSRRSINQYQLPMRKNADKLKGKQQLDLKSMISSATTSRHLVDPFDDQSGSKGIIVTEAMCKFRRDLIPPTRQLSYQLKDIEIDEVQVLVHSNDGREPELCAEKDGWLIEGSIEKIRKIMNKCLNQTMEAITNQLDKAAM